MLANVLTFLKGKWYLVLAGLLLIPYFAYRHMQERKAKELSENSYPLDDRFDGLKLVVDRDGQRVVYLDGTSKPADAIGIAVVTADDDKQQPERLKGQGLFASDFPVVVFFNVSGFDATGTPAVVRKVANGSQLFPKPAIQTTDVPPVRLRAAVPSRAGGWTAYYWDSPDWHGKVILSDDEWGKRYLGTHADPEQPKDLPPQADLDKMTDAQLESIGVRRVQAQKDKAPAGKTGVKGVVVKVGGVPAVVPLALPVLVFIGEIQPFKKGDASAPKPVASVHSGSDGSYSVDLPPGKYTVVVEDAGKLYGNAVKQDRWPAVTVPKDGWAEYDFRRGDY